MPPERKQVLNVEARKRLEVEEDLYFDQQAKLIAKELARPSLLWVDLPPNVHPVPERPPDGEGVFAVESIVSPDKRMPLVYLLGADEMACDQLVPFLNEDKNLLTIAPHVVNRYQAGGPISNDIFGPVSAGFVKVINDSNIGQSWHEVSVVCADEYVRRWCDAEPKITVLCLGFWDIVMGHVAWTPESVSSGVYGRYFLYHLDLFLSRAREYCRSIRKDFDAWMVHHRFLILQVPNWAQLTPDLETPYTVSINTWKRMRRVSYKDMYELESLLWVKYKAILYCPQIPLGSFGQQEQHFRLGEKLSRVYVAQVLAKVAKMVCARPCCWLPSDFAGMKDVLYEHSLARRSAVPPKRKRKWELMAVRGGVPAEKLGSCGKFFAFFLPKGKSLRDLF